MMGTPRHRPRAILEDSLSSLVPKEGTGRAPSHSPDSEEETDNRRTFVLASDAESKRDENGVHKAVRPNYVNNVCNLQGA